MKSFLRRTAAIAFAAMLVTLGFAAPAMATAYGTVGDLGVHAGKHYWSQAWISGYDRVGYASTWVGGTSDDLGYMGTRTFVYHDDGLLCNDSGYWYNYTHRRTTTAGTGYCGSDYYYSRVYSKVWNGDGYTEYAGFRSPNEFAS
jgi:hypothetical protein